MKTIITTKANYSQVLNANDKALFIIFGDWTQNCNELEFE